MTSQQSQTKLPPFHFTVQMWGEPYTSLFTEITLPMLLSPSNFPAIEGLSECVFDLYTTSEHVEEIKACAAFKTLEALLPVTIDLVDDMDRSNGHQAMSDCNRLAIQKSDDAERIIVFLQPDTLVADGTLGNMQRIMQSGKRVVQVPGFRTTLEEMLPELRKHLSEDGAVLHLPPRDTMRIAIPRMHPHSRECFWDSPEFTNYNAHMYFRVSEEGVFARCGHFHPLAIYPRVRHAAFKQTVDYNYFETAVPDFEEYYIADDSDELCMVEMSREDYLAGFHSPNTASVEGVVKWMEFGATRVHRKSFAKHIKLHADDGTGPAWDEKIALSESILQDVFYYTEKTMLQIVREHPEYRRLIFWQRLRLAMFRGEVTHKADRWIFVPLSPICKLGWFILGKVGVRTNLRKLKAWWHSRKAV